MTPDEKRAAYIARVVAEAPPLTAAQIDGLALLLRPETAAARGPRQPSAYELEERRKEQERQAALHAAKKLAESLTECDACNLQPIAHSMNQLRAFGFHEWVPGRAEKVMAERAAK